MQANTELISYKTPLIEKLVKGNRVDVNTHLATFKQNGVLDHRKILSIPSNERIPALVKEKEGRKVMLTVLSAAIMGAFRQLNLRVAMDEDQIVDLADEIIDSSHEDYLALEDVLLFLKDMITGKAGVINDRMDTPTFFKLFEVYRQTRHEEHGKIKEEIHAQQKGMGPSERWTDVNEQESRDLFHEALKQHYKPQE